jgi:glycosyltransferase involved in cell wall biosynthesis
MEFILIDSGLLDKGGHCYQLAKVVSESLSRRRLRYRWFGIHDLDPSIAAEIGIIPHFSRSLWEYVHLTPLERLQGFAAKLRRNPRRHSRGFEFRTWKIINQSFEQDLRALPQDVWNPENLVAVPAITQNQIMGLIRFLCALPRGRLPRVVCQLMFSPSFVPWCEISALGNEFYKEAFGLAAPLMERSLFFTVENEAMRATYLNDFGVQTRILPIPFCAPGPQRSLEGRARVGFFGIAKCEKGFHLLPGAIELCQRDGLDAEFIVQIQHNNWERLTIEAERALRGLKGVRFLEGALSSEDYGAWTGRTDVVLLPYDPVAFGATRGSGIFAESVAAGRPVIASQGTFAGISVENNEAEGEVFAPYTSEALAAAIARLLPRLSACKERAADRAKEFARSNNPDTYVDVLLALAKA